MSQNWNPPDNSGQQQPPWGGYSQREYVHPHVQQNVPPQAWQQPAQPASSVQPKGNAAKGCAMLGCGGAAAVFILVAALVSHGSGSPSAGQQEQPAAPAQSTAAGVPAAAAAAKHTVTYIVTGSPTQVTFGPAGDESTRSGPGHQSAKLGNPLYVSLEAQLQGSGSATCKILVDGTVISKHTASGGYSIAMCEISKDPFSGTWTDTDAG